ncbi:adenosylcobinamide-GDP ribazoletransferase [Cereibacter sp. SYSU M97828]|nr:adenosylcobinamide-GDP ribazoletransferase [Cereibacter flavus]
MIRARLDEARLALMTLSRLPVGRIARAVPMGAAVWAYPLAGLVVGAIGAAALVAGDALGLPPLASALLAIAAGALATGGLHEDGLADLADGFGGGTTPERRLEIMRDSRIGAHGALALMLAVGLLASLIASAPHWQGMLAVGAVSRAGLALPMILMPQARAGGFGAAAVLGMDWARVASALLIGLAVALMLVPMALALCAAVLAVQMAVAVAAQRSLGGLTGDVLGAAQVLGSVAGWIAIVAAH